MKHNMCRTARNSLARSGMAGIGSVLGLTVMVVVMARSSVAAVSSPRHVCERPCVEGAPPMSCRFHFHVEAYHSLSKACYDCPRNATDCARPHCIPAGGVRRSLVVVNRQMPGPAISVCKGDRVIVDVHNDMPEQSTSIHWHGQLQRGSPYMDGTPQITQCPIPPLAAFRYNFTADKAGTHMWHSHTGCQRADGAVGTLIVRTPLSLDPHRNLYDEDRPEHSLLMMDWTLRSANDKFAHHFHAGGDNKADTILINGKGRFGRSLSPEGDPQKPLDVPLPLEEFAVEQGKRYRFRVINAGYLNCPIELSVDNHTMLVISSDGGDLEPVRADVLVSYAGERWDVVLEVLQPIGAYRIRARGVLDCAPKRAHQEAILRYNGVDSQPPPDVMPTYDYFRDGLYVNPLNRKARTKNSRTAAELKHVRTKSGLPQDPALKITPDMQLLLAYDFFDVNNPLFNIHGLYGINEVLEPTHRTYTPQLNHISMQMPSFPLLPQRNKIRPETFCNESTLAAKGRNCLVEFCACVYAVDVPLGAVVEIILVDQGDRFDANHPFHLHGHAFRVVGVDRLGSSVQVDTIRRLDKEGRIRRNLLDAPVKDTVSVPDGGYSILRVHFNNPGYWLFHCHIDFHVELGMALVFKVGEHDQMPPVPANFPQCGNYFGDDDSEEASDDNSNQPADAAERSAPATVPPSDGRKDASTDKWPASTANQPADAAERSAPATMPPPDARKDASTDKWPASTESTTLQGLVSTIPPPGKYPEGAIQYSPINPPTPDLKDLYFVYPGAESKQKKDDKLSHNEVNNKGFVPPVQLEEQANLKQQPVESFIMRVPPRHAVTSVQQWAPVGLSLKDPGLTASDDSAADSKMVSSTLRSGGQNTATMTTIGPLTLALTVVLLLSSIVMT